MPDSSNSHLDGKDVANPPSANDVCVFDLSDRTQIELTGADRAKFLHAFCTNDIIRLRPGQGCEAFLTNVKGRVVGHVFVFVGANSLWLDSVPGQESAIIAHLDRYLIREDVQFIPHSTDFGELLVTGSNAASLLMLDQGIELYGFASRTAINGLPFQIRRVDLLGAPGFLLSLPRTVTETTRQSLLAVGCVAGSADQFESLRIAAGFPQFGVDMSDENMAPEVARTRQCISFTKGCYLGQEPIARLDAMGHTNRELRRIQFPGGTSMTRGLFLSADQTEEQAGIITSVAPLAGDNGEVFTLGYLKTKFCKPGTVVSVSSAKGTVLPTT